MQFPVETIQEAAAATTKDQLDTRMYFAVVAVRALERVPFPGCRRRNFG